VNRAGLVVFDLDGTLIDSSADLAAAVNATLARIAPEAPALPPERIRSFVGHGAGTLVERALAEARLPHRADAVLPLFLDGYREHMLDSTRLYPGVAEALASMSGYSLAVLSNKPGDLCRAILEGLGVARAFTRICGPEDVPARKPDPAGLRQLMEEAGAGPEDTAMVGDSPVDVRTGRAASVFTVGVSYGLDPEGLRADPPDLTLDDLRELPEHLRRPRPRRSVLR
jgi:phosphoglycolate phosphatase